MNVLVMGAYGLIGCSIARQLRQDGHHVIGLGRDLATARRVLPGITWRQGDLRHMTDAANWAPYLAGVEAVVNAAGALQDGPDDSVEAVHHLAVAALARACAPAAIRLVQISAIGVSPDADTAFFRSKARGDAAVRAAGAPYQIFRPGLVLAPHSYGGTALLRMLAAVPLIQPLALPEAKIQTVAADDVARVVSAAIKGVLPDGLEADLVEDTPHTLRDLVGQMRHWLGTGAARREIVIPDRVTTLIAHVADGLGRLGWRSPLRTTSIKVLANGVTGKPADLTPFGLAGMRPLSETLEAMPARAEDRLFARMALLAPVILTTLAMFWFVSGAIAILYVNTAAHVLESAGWAHGLAVASVLFWAVIDILVAAALIYRPWAKAACWAAVLVSLIYLLGASLVTPQLWLDPLGPLVKVLPGLVLAVVARITLETR